MTTGVYQKQKPLLFQDPKTRQHGQHLPIRQKTLSRIYKEQFDNTKINNPIRNPPFHFIFLRKVFMSCSESLLSMRIWYILIKVIPLYFVSFVAILRVNISFSLLLLHKTNDIWIILLTYSLADFCCVLSVDYFGYIIYNGHWSLLSDSDISPFFPYLLAKVFNTILNSWLLILEWWFNFLFARRHFFFKSQINSDFWVLFLYILR